MPIPQTPTKSTCGSSGSDSTFSSTISTSHPSGQNAARVASPRGRLMARLSGSISIHQRKFQKLSVKRGLMGRSFIGRSGSIFSWRLSGSNGDPTFRILVLMREKYVHKCTVAVSSGISSCVLRISHLTTTLPGNAINLSTGVPRYPLHGTP